jgi:hypothetical protein
VKRFFLVTAAILVMAALSSCASSVRLDGSSDVFYARNMTMEVNGMKFFGTGVVPRADRYEIKLKSEGKMDFLLVRSCHQSFKREDEGNDYKFTYVPVPGKEDNRACPLRFTGLEKDKGRTAQGWLDFQDPRKQLPGCAQCNGQRICGPGVIACEAAEGALTGVSFDVPVDSDATSALEGDLGIARTKACDVLHSADSQNFEFKMPRGECTITIQEKQAPYRQMRLSIYGFQQYQAGRF